ncbi:nucleoside phosphorylase [Mucilaginibacter sp. Bleaf8]|uniref:nucleoside phosphorylase n=1 Tax=Mucilaginibacter sp. Bleaf8 TaxID=2834430 RepID=UPI001BCE94DC|nr:nucleoside phosphorylase [Mucilaginibacter sp. Bleaf8]MBS7564007.1 nucleoside phosphorylase [Mucilaginibacter sp. Bleaf8]
MSYISETDLILNADGSAYHINLFPDEVANTVITVGDQDRVAEVSKYFDHIEVKKGKREFVTHTGRIGNKRLTVISTGIGTDNIDIVLNELDALVNINLQTRQIKPELKSLNIIRIGTSGAVQTDIEVDSLLASSAAFGLDPLMHYYEQLLTAHETALLDAFKAALTSNNSINPYFTPAGEKLLTALGGGLPQGITITAPGFYAPQGRQVRAKNTIPELMQIVQDFKFAGERITNLEMETAGIYGLAQSLGHQALSFNIILANRITHQFSKRPLQVMDNYIKQILERIVSSI